MNMRLATLAALCGIALLSVMHSAPWQAASSNDLQQCQQLQQQQAPQTVCANLHEEVSWLEWLTGESRSTQFHFLDFFELLFADKDQGKGDYHPSDYAGPKVRW